MKWTGSRGFVEGDGGRKMRLMSLMLSRRAWQRMTAFSSWLGGLFAAAAARGLLRTERVRPTSMTRSASWPTRTWERGGSRPRALCWPRSSACSSKTNRYLGIPDVRSRYLKVTITRLAPLHVRHAFTLNLQHMNSPGHPGSHAPTPPIFAVQTNPFDPVLLLLCILYGASYLPSLVRYRDTESCHLLDEMSRRARSSNVPPLPPEQQVCLCDGNWKCLEPRIK